MIHANAGVAHPVERHLAKVEVASSSLVTRSRKETAFALRTEAVSFQRNKSLAGFVKYALRVKYGFGGTRDGFDFIREVDFIVL